ncbi:MAG: DNA recombination protein RmuC [Acidiferrobacter sp.]
MVISLVMVEAFAAGVVVAVLMVRVGQRGARRVAHRHLADVERRMAEQAHALAQCEREARELALRRAQLEERVRYEQQGNADKLTLLNDARSALGDAFKGLSQEALARNNTLFLALAEERFAGFAQGAKAEFGASQTAIAHLVEPLLERLGRVDTLLAQIEIKRESAYQSLTDQLRALIDSHLPQLHRETASLVKALRQPTTRGRWGELQLRRVVEMAGMLNHCDFVEQGTVAAEDGRSLRPDLIVRLPGGRQVVVDAKTPIDAYLTAIEVEDEGERGAALKHHAAQVRSHLVALGKKNYWEQFVPTPEFVVMFVPGEVFFSAALQADPGLIECGVSQKVIPASPTTLIALLRAVSYGWQQEAIARNAEEIAALGRELYRRITVLGKGWSETGTQLRRAVECYNRAVGTLESRVLPQARRFRDLRAGDEDVIPPVEAIAEEPRPLTAVELIPPPVE